MNTEISERETSPSCEVCHCAESLKTCSRCHGAFYCGREHQVTHWTVHKLVCRDFRSDQAAMIVTRPAVGLSTPSSSLVTSTMQSAASPSTSNSVSAQAYATWCSDNGYVNDALPTTNNEVLPPGPTYSEWHMNNFIAQDPAVSSQTLNQTSNSVPEASQPSDLQIDKDLLAFTTKYLLSENYGDTSTGNVSMDYDLTSITEQIFDDRSSASLAVPVDRETEETEFANSVPIQFVCDSVVHDINLHGICVIDMFLGSELGEQILGEAKELFQRGIYQKGQLVNPNMSTGIRGDLISWVRGTEPGCEYIGKLIRRLDDVMIKCSRIENNGILSTYKLGKRTKAMVACYPGNGTHYKKHVDNPNEDGRCVTCIYYLNKDWNVEKHGGLLRMFPTSHENEVANIEPFFDRMLFFWSDRRNPHEVLPSYAVRYAITVWYFDIDERQLALIKSSLQQKQ